MTMYDWLETWVELYVEPSDLADSTKTMYRQSVAAVPAWLGTMEMADVSALELRRWLLDVAKTHSRAAQLDRQMLSRAMKIAGKLGLCRTGLVDADVCPQIRHETKKAVILTPDELRAYTLGACAMTDPAAPGLMLCACGLRRSEARGVLWSDIDFAAGTVRIDGQRRGNGQKQRCKSAASVRTISLPPAVLDALQRHLRAAESVWACPVTEYALYTAHRKHLALLNLNSACTLHGLRHSIATAAVMAGEPLKLVQGYLGHANYQLTANVYANHLPPVVSFSHYRRYDWKSCVG